MLGINPGAVGTQRLPRLAGADLALEMCTDGKPIGAARAKAAGVVDEIITGDLRAGAIDFARARRGATRRTREISIDAAAAARAREACARKRAMLKASHGVRAPFAAIDAIEAAFTCPFPDGSLRERELFAE